MKTTKSNSNYAPSTVINNKLNRNFSLLRRGKFLALTLLGAGWLATYAHANALTGFYTQVAAADPDFGSGAGSILANGLVQSQLGPDGLPVLSAAGITRLGTTSDMNATTHELLWWSPSADPFVSNDLDPVQINTVPMNFGYPNTNWYPTGQTSDQNFFRSVHWEGTFDLTSAGSVSLSMTADDDGWLYIDGTLATETHYSTASISPMESAGMHTIDIFYDDRIPVYDSFALTSSVTLSPVPEPGITTLFVAGAACVVVCGWRRQKQVTGR